ncbi:hypothetical protein FRB93_013159 [Tulasnella sp. JGI-2019a]|nr:hypothetical protein FRB93_013159 [Tulasnella sp. JGI-2019a]
MSPVNSTDMTPVDHSVMYLNNYIQKMNLLWRKEAKADDEKRGLGWSATIHGTMILVTYSSRPCSDLPLIVMMSNSWWNAVRIRRVS